MVNNVNIISIFKSIDGEVNSCYQGRVTTFLRLSGCNILCTFCDTRYSFKKGHTVPIDDVVSEILSHGTGKVTITGGEPLLQIDAVNKIIEQLLMHGKNVTIETNGTIVPTQYIHYGYRVSWVVDYKLPSSGVEDKMNMDVFTRLSSYDFVKFLVADRKDFDRSLVIKEKMKKLGCQAEFAYSPIEGMANKQQVVEWVINEGSGSDIVNIQLHKIIWPECGASMER